MYVSLLKTHAQIEEEAEMYTDDIFSFHTESSVQPSVRHSEVNSGIHSTDC